MSEDKTLCPHCGTKMKKFQTPGESSWGESLWYVCFNNDCSYYVRGWDHMMKTMKAVCSYRHRYNPDTGECGPMPVQSPTMGLTNIVE
ncbi:MAG: ogr/Delta-like zinc finger family protein [Pseudomonadota bacterium]